MEQTTPNPALLRRRRARRRTIAQVAAASLVATAATIGGLSVQMATGSDPALGPKINAATVNTQTHQNSRGYDLNKLAAYDEGDDENETSTTASATTSSNTVTPTPVTSGASGVGQTAP